jgi:hypothetical protein
LKVKAPPETWRVSVFGPVPPIAVGVKVRRAELYRGRLVAMYIAKPMI